jgi:5-methyltetrahydropteroyltriglutamate--homocysteine methyltransferase
MPERPRPPFRADHVGSLLRPPELLKARDDFRSGRLSAAELRAAEDDAIRQAVSMQEDIGLHGVTDGEFRRNSWHMDFYRQIGGVAEAQESAPVQFHNEQGVVEFSVKGLQIAGRFNLDKTIFGEDFQFLKSVARATPKLTIPAPSVLHRRGGHSLIDRRIYPDMEVFWADLATVYAEEIARLGALGCTYLQLDDTSFATLCDPAHRRAMAGIDSDGEHIHSTYIRLINEALKRKPDDMAVCVHTCRGNFRGAWFASGGYDFIAEALFGELAVDGFFLEYDDARAGGFEPLRFVPKGKMVVLGLVSTKRGTLETKDEIKRRIDEATKYLPLDQICLSPQCGFSSVVGSNAVAQDEQIAKLRLVVDVAREIWG